MSAVDTTSSVTKEKRESKCRDLRFRLHEYCRQNPSPSDQELRALKDRLEAEITLPPNHAPITTWMLTVWFRDQCRYRQRYKCS